MRRGRLRIEYDGAVYHAIQRSSNREKIFGKDADKRHLLALLSGQRQKLGFRLFGYAIMDNHYHLLLQTGSIPLSKVMHRVNYLYSRYYNRSNNRHGYVFGGRYKAALIQEDGHLFAVLRYIHQNPVRAGICRQVADYAWSSDAAYRENNNSMVRIDFILNTLSGDREAAIKLYQQMMSEEEAVDYGKMNMVGDDDFIKLHTAETEIMAENSNPGAKRNSLEEILSSCGAPADDINLIRSGSRKRGLTLYKRKFAQQAAGEGYTQKQIGAFINISGAAANKLISYEPGSKKALT